ncbi:MAG: DUF86 domain-containing protein, partial [Planctomycetes bacterium]|nr:DUF86 domain-containing protein [Planctomycetota bacterium]
MKKETVYRLAKHVSFLEEELKDYEKFVSLSWEEYNGNRSKRRDIERWIENIINSSIDIAKIILSSEGLKIADNYKEMIMSLSLITEKEKKMVERLSSWIKLRNIITHEYLDIRWSSV